MLLASLSADQIQEMTLNPAQVREMLSNSQPLVLPGSVHHPPPIATSESPDFVPPDMNSWDIITHPPEPPDPLYLVIYPMVFHQMSVLTVPRS